LSFPICLVSFFRFSLAAVCNLPRSFSRGFVPVGLLFIRAVPHFFFFSLFTALFFSLNTLATLNPRPSFLLFIRLLLYTMMVSVPVFEVDRLFPFMTPLIVPILCTRTFFFDLPSSVTPPLSFSCLDGTCSSALRAQPGWLIFSSSRCLDFFAVNPIGAWRFPSRDTYPLYSLDRHAFRDASPGGRLFPCRPLWRHQFLCPLSPSRLGCRSLVVSFCVRSRLFPPPFRR